MSEGNEARARRYAPARAAKDSWSAQRSRVADPGARRRRSGAVEEQGLLPGIEDERARWAEFDACFTPAPVVVQFIDTIPKLVRLPTRARTLDPSAGGGVFGKVIGEMRPDWHRTAVEPRDEEVPYLERNYDDYYVGTAQRFAESIVPEPFDLAAGNPPWWCWGDIFDAVWPLVIEGGALALLGPSTWGHSDESSECIDVFERVCPAYQLRVRGRIAFNGGSSTDNRKCSWWVWCNDGVARDSTTMITLPALPPEARRWSVRPGTEG
jgi:hypothetical protein